MKKLYRYFLIGDKYIIRSYAWKITTEISCCYHEVNKALFDRAEKYGYIKVVLD